MSNYLGRGIDQIDNISTLDNLSFNGSLQTFNLTQNSVAFVPVSADALQIQIDGVIQANNFTISGSTLTFDFVPSGSSVCNSVKHFGVGIITSVSDGAVTNVKLGADSVNGSKIADDSISDEHLDITAITGQTAITSLADTDKFLVSDASDSGNLKYVEKQYLPSGGFVRVGGGSAAGQNLGTLSFDNFSSTYNLYYVQYRINFVADGSQLLMRVRNSSGFKTNAGYFFGLNGVNQAGTNSDINGAGSTSFRLSGGTTSNDGHHSCLGNLWFYYPHDSSKVVAWTGSAQETDESYIVTSRWGGGEYQVAETTVGFGFTGNTQNIEQYNVQIFGVKES